MLVYLKKYSIQEVLLLLILITLPLPEHWNSKALLALLIFVLYGFYRNFKFDLPQISWFYMLFFSFTALSFFWSLDTSETLKGIISLFPFLLFTIAYYQIFRFISVDKILKITAFIFLIYVFTWLILAYFRFTESNDFDTFYYHNLTAPFGANAIYIALIFGQLYLFLLYDVLFSTNKTKPLELVLTILLFGVQFLLSSKMILTVLILLTLIFFIKYFRLARFKRKILVLGLILSFSIFILLGISTFTKNRFIDILNVEQIENVFSQDYFGPGYYWNGLTLRLFQLRCAFDIEKEPDFNSILGTGFKASQPVLNTKYAKYDLYRGPDGVGENNGYFIYNFHNQYAQLIIELGLFGGILIILMLYFFVLHPLKSGNILL